MSNRPINLGETFLESIFKGRSLTERHTLSMRSSQGQRQGNVSTVLGLETPADISLDWDLLLLGRKQRQMVAIRENIPVAELSRVL